MELLRKKEGFIKTVYNVQLQGDELYWSNQDIIDHMILLDWIDWMGTAHTISKFENSCVVTIYMD